LRALAVEIAVKIPDHGICIEIGAVVELDALAQMKNPGLVVGWILLPFLRKPGTQGGQPVGSGQVPKHQTFEDWIAEEAHSLEAVIGEPRCGRDIRRRHGDAQSGFSRCGRRRQQRGQQRNRAGSLANEHDLSPVR
jgi:hypothetical protein